MNRPGPAQPAPSERELANLLAAARAAGAPRTLAVPAIASFFMLVAIFLHASPARAFLLATPGSRAAHEESQMKMVGAAVVSSFLAASGAVAQDAVQWRVEDGGNGHWYAVVESGVGFQDAMTAAEAIGAHLVTITSAGEQGFISSSVASTVSFPTAWMGLVQQKGAAEPLGGWRWVTGEPLVGYTNWWSGVQQPDNNACSVGVPENVAMWSKRWGGTWADTVEDLVAEATCVGVMTKALIEWSADCNGDGIVDFGQIRDGTLADGDQDNIPDCCENGTACVSNLLVNGGFEIGPTQINCTWVVYGTSSTFIPGWSVVAVSVDRERLGSSCPIGTESWTSFSGEFTIDLDGGAAGGAIAQTVATLPGRNYRLSFQLTGNCTFGDKPMRVEIGSSSWNFVHSCAASNPQPWKEKSVEFEATGQATTIVLRSLMTDGRNGPVVDAIRLEEVVSNCPGDVDDSGAVNGVDLAAILNVWGTSGGKYPGADCNGDGVVDAIDLSIVLNAWGPCN
jgi:hypothetical protein